MPACLWTLLPTCALDSRSTFMPNLEVRLVREGDFWVGQSACSPGDRYRSSTHGKQIFNGDEHCRIGCAVGIWW